MAIAEAFDEMRMHQVLHRAGQGRAPSEAERAALADWLLADPSQTGFFGFTPERAAAAVGWRLERLPAVCRALAEGPPTVAGYAESVEPSVGEVFRYHLPLAQWLVERVSAAEGRFLVAIAGVPAGGKSVFAALLARIVAALGPPFDVVSAGLDGYHYPNAYLLANPAPPDAAEPGVLKLYKGAHFTFDATRLVADLRRLRSAREPVALPAYDRTVHEPVEGRIHVGPDDRLVLVEGNYLLCREQGWRQVPDLFDLRVFLDLPPGANREPMIARHMRGGRSRPDAERHYERSDLPNTALVARTRAEADIVVELDAGHAVIAVSPGPRGAREPGAQPPAAST